MASKIRLWLDDVRLMPEGFTHHAKTAHEANALLDGGEVEHISLDFDLGTIPVMRGSVLVVEVIDESAGCGEDVAAHIARGAFTGALPRLTWAIHSMNPVGRQRMQWAMERAERSWAYNERGAALDDLTRMSEDLGLYDLPEPDPRP